MVHPTPRIGLVAATALTAGAFMLVHSAFYLCLALAASLVTWRTGGLEAATALHVVANLTTMLFLPFLGLDDRAADSAQTLAQVAALILTAAALLCQIRRIGLPVRAAPGSNPA